MPDDVPEVLGFAWLTCCTLLVEGHWVRDEPRRETDGSAVGGAGSGAGIPGGVINVGSVAPGAGAPGDGR